MKRHHKSDIDSVRAHGQRIRRSLAIVGAVSLVFLLNGCASTGSFSGASADNSGSVSSTGSGDPNPWSYDPNTGYPAVGSRRWY
jgi:hypothetical protein